MAVSSCAKLTTRVSTDENGQRTYVSMYRIITTDKDDGASTVMVYSGLDADGDQFPQFGSTYSWGNSYDTGVYAYPYPTDVKLEREEQAFRKVWIAQVTHGPPKRDQEDKPEDDPRDEPWSFERDADEWVEEAQRDKDDKAITNSALQPFTGKQVEVFRRRARLSLSKNLSTYDPSLIDDVEGSVNQDGVTIAGTNYPPRCLYLRKIRVTRAYFGPNIPYYPTSFQIDVNMGTFDLIIPDMGTRRYIGTNPKNPDHYEFIRESPSNEVVTTPVPLNGSGGVASADGDGKIAIAQRVFRYYHEYPWGSLNFPATV